MIHEKIFAILEIVGLKAKKDLSLYRILVERFISEMQRVRLYSRVERLAKPPCEILNELPGRASGA